RLRRFHRGSGKTQAERQGFGLNWASAMARRQPTPHVTLKLATSLDGRIATAAGESRWITQAAARAHVQRMRAEADAIMVGGGTVRADDPQLLARVEPPPLKRALRVVLDTAFSLSPRGRLFATLAQAPLLVIGADGEDAALVAAGARTAKV